MEIVEFRGVIVAWRENHRGEVHGFVMDDGTEVRFPPHEAPEVTSRFDVGDAVEGPASPHRVPDEPHVDAIAIRGDAGAVELDTPPPAPPPVARPRPRRHPADSGPSEGWSDRRLHEDIEEMKLLLKELQSRIAAPDDGAEG